MSKWIKEGLQSLKTITKDKREYRAYQARIKALPEEYAFVYNKITHYMWSHSGGGNGYDMLKLQYDLIELFEVGAAEHKPVLEITGDDVAVFADELLANARTYAGNQRAKLNSDIHRKLGHKRDE